MRDRSHRIISPWQVGGLAAEGSQGPPTVARPASQPADKWTGKKALVVRFRQEGMSPGTQHIALLVSTYADGDGDGDGTSIRPTIETLTQVSGKSKSTIKDASGTSASTVGYCRWVEGRPAAPASTASPCCQPRASEKTTTRPLSIIDRASWSCT